MPNSNKQIVSEISVSNGRIPKSTLTHGKKDAKVSFKDKSSAVINPKCSKRNKPGDLPCVCHTKKTEGMKIVTLDNLDEENYEREWSLGGVPAMIKKNKSVWLVPLKLANKVTIFKIDTGASVTVIPLTTYESLGLGEIESTSMMIFGASGHALDVVGEVRTTISRLGSSKPVVCNVAVIRGLQQSLLGLGEIQALNLVSLNLEENDDAKPELVKKDTSELQDKIPENPSKSLVSKTNCWQDEFLSPFFGLGAASCFISPPMSIPMMWTGNMLTEMANKTEDGIIKSPRKRRRRHRHHDNPADTNYESIVLTLLLLKDVIPKQDVNLNKRHGPHSVMWSRHNP